METSRRNFLKSLGLGVSGLGIFGLSAKDAKAELRKKLGEIKATPAREVAQDEDFWFYVQQAFNIDRSSSFSGESCGDCLHDNFKNQNTLFSSWE